jgi:hypothetical protein
MFKLLYQPTLSMHAMVKQFFLLNICILEKLYIVSGNNPVGNLVLYGPFFVECLV